MLTDANICTVPSIRPGDQFNRYHHLSALGTFARYPPSSRSSKSASYFPHRDTLFVEKHRISRNEYPRFNYHPDNTWNYCLIPVYYIYRYIEYFQYSLETLILGIVARLAPSSTTRTLNTDRYYQSLVHDCSKECISIEGDSSETLWDIEAEWKLSFPVRPRRQVDCLSTWQWDTEIGLFGRTVALKALISVNNCRRRDIREFPLTMR